VAEPVDSKVRKFLEELAQDPIEEMVVEYVVREVRNGRKLREVLNDPYVRNRLDADRISKVLENPEVIGAVEGSISKSFETKDFGFSE
jgi:hypothetical protein